MRVALCVLVTLVLFSIVDFGEFSLVLLFIE